MFTHVLCTGRITFEFNTKVDVSTIKQSYPQEFVNELENIVREAIKQEANMRLDLRDMNFQFLKEVL